MNRAVAIVSFSVKKAGEWVYFQVNIPRRSNRIVEVGFTAFDWPAKWDFRPLTFTPQTVGEIKLSWQERGDVFFAAPVDNHQAMLRDEISLRVVSLPFRFTQGLWDFGSKITPLSVDIHAENTTLFGLYRDRINTMAATVQTYTVNAYFYFETGDQL